MDDLAAQLDRIEQQLAELRGHLAAGPHRYLSVAQAATYAGVSDDTIRRALAAGHLTPLRPCRGRLVVDRHQIDAWLQSTANQRLRRGRGIRKAIG